MKRLLSLCLLLALVFSLCIPAAPASALSPDEILEKYGTLIDAIESGDYEAAKTEFGKLFPELTEAQTQLPAAEPAEEPMPEPEPAEEPMPEPEPVEEPMPEPEPVEEAPEQPQASGLIELTPENFFDYFELVLTEPYVERNSKGKIKWIDTGSYKLQLKPEYEDRYNWSKSDEITIGVTGKAYFHRAKIDWKTGEITVSSKANKDVRKAIKKDSYISTSLDTQLTGHSSFYVVGSTLCHKEKLYGSHYYWSSSSAKPGDDYKYYQSVWKITIENVSGSIYLDP